MYECLSCNHKAKVQGKLKYYSEVLVCANCSTGAFVDMYKIQKYK